MYRSKLLLWNIYFYVFIALNQKISNDYDDKILNENDVPKNIRSSKDPPTSILVKIPLNVWNKVSNKGLDSTPNTSLASEPPIDYFNDNSRNESSSDDESAGLIFRPDPTEANNSISTPSRSPTRKNSSRKNSFSSSSSSRSSSCSSTHSRSSSSSNSNSSTTSDSSDSEVELNGIDDDQPRSEKLSLALEKILSIDFVENLVEESDASSSDSATDSSKRRRKKRFLHKNHKCVVILKQKVRKRVLDPTTHIDFKAKEARNSGVAGVGRKGKPIAARVMCAGCGEKCRQSCHERFSKQSREYAHRLFYNLKSRCEKWQCLNNYVISKEDKATLEFDDSDQENRSKKMKLKQINNKIYFNN